MSTILYGSRAEEPPDPPTFLCAYCGQHEVWGEGEICEGCHCSASLCDSCPVEDEIDTLIEQMAGETTGDRFSDYLDMSNRLNALLNRQDACPNMAEAEPAQIVLNQFDCMEAA